jgi:hypothetical protein
MARVVLMVHQWSAAQVVEALELENDESLALNPSAEKISGA